jgi:DASH complex subunit ASK1
MREDISENYTNQPNEDATTATGVEQSTFQAEDSMLDDAELSGSTPRPGKTKTRFSDMESPYEVMKREMEDEDDGHDNTTVLDGNEDSTILFAQHTARLPDMSMTPQGQRDHTMTEEQSVQPQKDPLLHRVLDKNYRIQATPHKSALRTSPLKSAQPKSAKKNIPTWNDSPGSSPEMAVPTLRSEAFMSPYKSNARQRLAAATQGPRTPGVSVQTPATARKTRDVFAAEDSAKGKDRYELNWDSDEDDEDIDLYAGMSPPKTIQFALPPSKLLQTPAREASQRIVGDILIDAGADPNSSEYSPSMVKMNEDILDDSF